MDAQSEVAAVKGPGPVFEGANGAVVALPGVVVGAAGCFGDVSLGSHGGWFDGLGAVTTRTSTRGRRRGRMRIAESPAGLIYESGTATAGVADIEAAIGRVGRRTSVPIIVSLTGDRPQDVTEAVAELAGLSGVSAIEITLAVSGAATEVMEAPERVAAFVEAATLASDLPVFVKLTPWTGTVDAAAAAEQAGAAAVVVGHGWPAMFPPDVAQGPERSQPAMLVGPAVRPLTMRLVAEVAGSVSIGVIGCGGITCTEDARAYLRLGARAIQIGSLLLRDPWAAAVIASELGARVG